MVVRAKQGKRKKMPTIKMLALDPTAAVKNSQP
jgi:hypothetical protein